MKIRSTLIVGIITLLVIVFVQAVGFGDPSPDIGTPDNGTFETQGAGFSSTLSNYTSTQSDNSDYFAVLRNNGIAESTNLEAVLNLTYNITPLTDLGVNAQKISNLSFTINYCLNNDVDGSFACEGTDTPGTANNPHDVELFNFSSGQFVDVGDYTLNDSSPEEFNATNEVLSSFSDYISSDNLIIIRYKINVTLDILDQDAAFGVDYAPVTITYDNIAPEINLTYPNNITYNSVQSLLNYTVSDETSLDACWYSTNQGSANTTITCGNNVTGLDSGQGSSTWIVYANDTSGNENSSAVTFFVDSIFPLISYGAGTESNGSTISRSNIYINVSVTETNENSITFRLHNSTSEVNASTSSNNARTINWTQLPDEVYTFNVTVNDTVENSNTTITRAVTVDTTSPDSGSPGGGSSGGGSFGKAIICTRTNQCQEGFACRENKCVRLFDVKLKKIESPANKNDFLDFTYFIKEVGGISDDVIAEFSLKDFKTDNLISKAGETIFVREGEESSHNSFIFIPSDFEGLAVLEVIIIYQEYSVKAFQTIEIKERLDETMQFPKKIDNNTEENILEIKKIGSNNRGGSDLRRYILVFIFSLLLIYLIYKTIKKIVNEPEKRDRNGIMIMDSRIIEELEKKTKGMDLKDKWVIIKPNKEDQQL